MEAKPLIHIHDLIAETWRDYKKNWNEMLRISAWLVVGPAFYFLCMLLAQLVPAILGAMSVVGTSISFVVTLWAMVRIMLWTLAKNRGDQLPKNESRLAGAMLLAFFWIALLNGLAVLGGFILFVLPGIWLTINFKFCSYAFLEDGKRGTQALAASAALVKGRWWAIFWRIILPDLLFFILYVAVVSVMTAAIGAIAGLSRLDILMTAQPTTANPLVFAIRDLMQGVGQMLFLPIFILIEVKMFHLLKKSR